MFLSLLHITLSQNASTLKIWCRNTFWVPALLLGNQNWFEWRTALWLIFCQSRENASNHSQKCCCRSFSVLFLKCTEEVMATWVCIYLWLPATKAYLFQQCWALRTYSWQRLWAKKKAKNPKFVFPWTVAETASFTPCTGSKSQTMEEVQ